MNDTKFSIIVPISNDESDISQLFKITDNNSEIILVDTRYSDRKLSIPQKANDYSRVLHLPPFSYKYNTLNVGTVHLINTGFAFAEHDRIIILDRIMEFRDNFFKVLREDIKEFQDSLGTQYFITTGQSLLNSKGNIKWKNYIIGTNSRFQFIKNSSDFPISFLCVHKDTVSNLNGMDERYNIGSGYYFDNFMMRARRLGCQTIFDQYLMTYDDYRRNIDDGDILNYFLFKSEESQLIHGKVRAFNPYNIDQLKDASYIDKGKYIIHP